MNFFQYVNNITKLEAELQTNEFEIHQVEIHECGSKDGPPIQFPPTFHKPLSSITRNFFYLLQITNSMKDLSCW